MTGSCNLSAGRSLRSKGEIKSRSVALIAVGDLAFNGAYHKKLYQRGPDYPFRRVKPAWSVADLRLGNLESPITDQRRVTTTKLTLRGTERAIGSLSYAGIDCVTLANNHMMDFGPHGLADTCARLDEANIAHVGAGMNREQASAPIVLKRRGLRVGILAACDVEQVSPLYATIDGPGVAALEHDRMLSDVRNLRSDVDCLVVQLHWGVEMSRLPTNAQRSFARKLVDAGVDVLLGHHPHVLQPVEEIDGRTVAYSLGDFTFSSTFWRGANSRENFLAHFKMHPLSRETGWLEVEFRRDGSCASLFHAARLSPDLSVHECDSPTRNSAFLDLARLLDDDKYERLVKQEEALAVERDRWRLDGKRITRRLALKLLDWGLLPGRYVEPDGVHWRRATRN